MSGVSYAGAETVVTADTSGEAIREGGERGGA